MDARLPVNAAVSLQRKTYEGSPNLPVMTLSANSQMQLTLLSGDVKAYAELCIPLAGCLRKEKTIHTWDGLRLGDDLFTPISKDYPLNAVRAAHPPRRP